MANEEKSGEGTVSTASEEASDQQVSQDAKWNAIARSHAKREMKPLMEQQKALDQKLSAILERLNAAPEAEGKKGDKDKVDPQLKLMQEQVEKLTRASQAAEERAKSLELKAKKDSIRAQIREVLDAKGIKGAKMAALVSHFEANHVREDEAGETMFVSTRSRSKGAPAEPLEFDIRSGIEDWCKTSEAAEFLPAPSRSDAPRSGGVVSPGFKKAPKFDAPAVTDGEAVRRTVQQLEAQGVNVSAILDE